MALRIREIPVTREFPRLELFPPVSRETGISREFPTRGFPLNIIAYVERRGVRRLQPQPPLQPWQPQAVHVAQWWQRPPGSCPGPSVWPVQCLAAD